MRHSPLQDTIFALASGAGSAAIAVIRITGPETSAVLTRLARRLPAPRRASVRVLRDDRGQALDSALLLWMPGPASYTGEDSAELFVHGGPAVITAVSSALLAAGARPADPGEFSRRAFLSGKQTLTEAEAAADLIAAETELQRAQAVRQLQGGLDALIGKWTDDLSRAIAFHEACLDFPEDASHEDAPAEEINALAAEMEGHLGSIRPAQRIRNGVVIAIVGPPNVGKSSLINRLSGREVAIVSPSAGTTRDVLESRLSVEGVPVTFADTAGLRVSDDEVESEGVRRALLCAEKADCVLSVTDPFTPLRPCMYAAHRIDVTNKSDLGPPHPETVAVSARTGRGMDVLWSAVQGAVRQLTAFQGGVAFTRERHWQAATVALQHLRRGMACDVIEFRVEEFRLALSALGDISGRGSTEEILGHVFSRFCIGK